MRRWVLMFALMICAAMSTSAQESFRWVDFHPDGSGVSKDQDIVVWVTRALQEEKWTAIREIGVLYDAALVVTVERAAPDASPATDTFQIWSVSLKSHLLTPVLKGVNLRWQEPIQFAPGVARELTVMYDDCRECAVTTYFTALYYDVTQHVFTARWLRGAQTVPVWTTVVAPGVTEAQVYAVLPGTDGGEFLGAWSHFDFGTQKPAQDYVFRYDRDPLRGLERTLSLNGKDAEAMKDKLCSAQVAAGGMARGQESEMCQLRLHPDAKPGMQRRVVTTPPANNQGRSFPPGAKQPHN
ncbi:hypothetical protein [Terracidiphilus gabretensis]|uniref:hypothetical protein n=1 Tax=Terracidiphilus gabretensis TaxID=1577687 RepID=UPI0012FAFAA5|nr:hypothetical protein [Terracidiphilus gabretensis]